MPRETLLCPVLKNSMVAMVAAVATKWGLGLRRKLGCVSVKEKRLSVAQIQSLVAFCRLNHCGILGYILETLKMRAEVGE